MAPEPSRLVVDVALTEQEIVRGLRAGDRQAWDALCADYGPRVWSHVARLIGRDSEAIADVVQETFLAVARGAPGLREETRLWSWLARIGHNQAALYWRKRYRQRQALATVARPTQSGDDPAVALIDAQTVECVRRLLSEMRADHVALLTAKYIDGLSVSEIVDRLGGTVESVRSSLARARRDFRERYHRVDPCFSERESPPASRGSEPPQPEG